MYRVSVMSSGAFAKEIDLKYDSDIEDIESLTCDGESVILTEDLENTEELIGMSIEIVEN